MNMETLAVLATLTKAKHKGVLVECFDCNTPNELQEKHMEFIAKSNLNASTAIKLTKIYTEASWPLIFEAVQAIKKGK